MKTAKWFLIFAVGSAWVGLRAQAQLCQLPNGLDTQWDQSYRALNGINRAERQQYESAFALLDRVTKQYADFAEALGKLEATSDGPALRACCRAVDSDRVARQLCARSEYVVSGRKDAGPFLRTLPRNREELERFWRLDSIVSPDTVSMALGSKALEELVRLVYEDRPEALEIFMFMWSDADGAFGEDMSDSLAALFATRPDIVVRRWALIRSYRKRLGNLRDYFNTDSREVAAKYRAFCKANDRSCSEIVALLE